MEWSDAESSGRAALYDGRIGTFFEMMRSRALAVPAVHHCLYHLTLPSRMDRSPDASRTSFPVWFPPAPMQPEAASENVPLRHMADRLAHRLRGLINGIEVYTDLLTDTLATAEQRELSCRILEGTARLERVVRDLRRFSTPIFPVARAVSIESFMETMQQAVGPAAWERVIVRSSPSLPDTIQGDPMLLRQALLALIQNALDAAPKRTVQVDVDALPKGHHSVRFDVWNAGAISGTPPHDVVFEPFFSTKSRRLGMGLPLARRIAASHGGSLDLIHSNEKDGTRFALALPSRPVRANEMLHGCTDPARSTPTSE